MPKKKKIKIDMRLIASEVIKRDGLKCRYCGSCVVIGSSSKNGMILEHVNGRDNNINNLCVSCRSCNSKKGNMTAIEWLDYTRDKMAELKTLYKREKNIISLIKDLGIGHE